MNNADLDFISELARWPWIWDTVSGWQVPCVTCWWKGAWDAVLVPKLPMLQDQDNKISGLSVTQVLQSLFCNMLDWYTTNEYIPNKQGKKAVWWSALYPHTSWIQLPCCLMFLMSGRIRWKYAGSCQGLSEITLLWKDTRYQDVKDTKKVDKASLATFTWFPFPAHEIHSHLHIWMWLGPSMVDQSAVVSQDQACEFQVVFLWQCGEFSAVRLGFP